LDIKHGPGGLGTELSRPKDSNVLEEFTFHLFLIELNEAIKTLRISYSRDMAYQRILQALNEGKLLYHFYLDDSLLHFKNPDGSPRLCLPHGIYKDTFETFHDRNGLIRLL
jgi:hypothetical protein